MAPEHREWNDTEPYKSVLANDMAGIEAAGMKVLARSWWPHAHEHDHRHVLQECCRLVCNREAPSPAEALWRTCLLAATRLLTYLRDNGFRTFIVSDGGVEFMRVFADSIYDVPPEQVIGSSGVVKHELGADGKAELMKEPKVEFIDLGKPVAINRFMDAGRSSQSETPTGITKCWKIRRPGAGRG